MYHGNLVYRFVKTHYNARGVLTFEALAENRGQSEHHGICGAVGYRNRPRYYCLTMAGGQAWLKAVVTVSDKKNLPLIAVWRSNHRTGARYQIIKQTYSK